jgi:hypothetical protein
VKQYSKDNRTYIETNPDDQQEIIMQALKAGFFSNDNKDGNYVLDFDYMYSQESNNITKHYFMNTSMQFSVFRLNPILTPDYYNKLKQIIWTVPGDNRIATEPPKLQAEKELEKPAIINFDKAVFESGLKEVILTLRELGLYGDANE